MIRWRGEQSNRRHGIPRESGDDPDDLSLAEVRESYSPRERG